MLPIYNYSCFIVVMTNYEHKKQLHIESVAEEEFSSRVRTIIFFNILNLVVKTCNLIAWRTRYIVV